jgi:hypothetical protein
VALTKDKRRKLFLELATGAGYVHTCMSGHAPCGRNSIYTLLVQVQAGLGMYIASSVVQFQRTAQRHFAT